MPGTQNFLVGTVFLVRKTVNANDENAIESDLENVLVLSFQGYGENANFTCLGL